MTTTRTALTLLRGRIAFLQRLFAPSESIALLQAVFSQQPNPAESKTMKTLQSNDDSDLRHPVDEEFSNSHDDGASSSGVSTNADGAVSAKPEHAIATKETQDVLRLKLVVLLVLVGSAVAVALITYFYLTRNEESQFSTQFDDDAHKILEAIGSSLDKTLASFDSLAVSLVSTAKMTNQSWPFVTIANFAVRMSKILPLSDAMNIVIVPIVKPEHREKWEAYSLQNDHWINEGMEVQEGWDGYYGPIVYNATHNHIIHGDYEDIPRNTSRILLPTWQNFPVIPNTSYTYNWDWLSTTFSDAFFGGMMKHKAVISAPYMIPPPNDTELVEQTKLWAEFNRNFIGPDEEPMEPMSDFAYPIVDDIDEVRVAGAQDYDASKHNLVGMVSASIYWRQMLRNILPTGSNGIRVVFENTCSGTFTYQINGPAVEYLGVGDFHNSAYDMTGKHTSLNTLGNYAQRRSVYSGAKLDDEFCPLNLHVYPSDVMKADYSTKNPMSFMFAALGIFAFVSLVFFVYDMKVERRQQTVLSTAVRSTAIVSSLFPEAVRDKLYPKPTDQSVASNSNGATPDMKKRLLQNFLSEGTKASHQNSETANSSGYGSSIADLYPDTTVLFADIAGFTAWSSVRHPGQVFHLLETLFGAFDAIAKHRGIFKVETIGDCYVAVVGLPAPRKHHAVAMVRFAQDCRNKFLSLVGELEKILGPGTADLALRIGMNSGPTTAGVLRGEKSRFQLFGDTVNTAARMESNGDRNKIHVSQKTAELLISAGKEHWLFLRNDKVDCKGKGRMTTYWCEPNSLNQSVSGSEASANTSDTSFHCDENEAKLRRLVDWNVEVLSRHLEKILQSRDQRLIGQASVEQLKLAESFGLPVDEVNEEISFPLSSLETNANREDVPLGSNVSSQLRDFVEMVAISYKGNKFHNFDHCSHVVMSTKKLLDRINGNEHVDEPPIVLDPLTQFALLFSALIHDVDHAGVSNEQLVLEQTSIAIKYEGKSVAEQNSVDVAWGLLMQPKFAELQHTIFTTAEELARFRQVVVHAVIATDLFDKNLKAMRESLWKKVFDDSCEDVGCQLNCKVAAVIQLIIQASDVSHTMQHFTVYKKWNMNLLAEMYSAFQCGRMNKDPTEGWYEGELWFFDNYVIPLAQKLRKCNVFGVSCDEFLHYAHDNRAEWEMKGRGIVAEAKLAMQKIVTLPQDTGYPVEL